MYCYYYFNFLLFFFSRELVDSQQQSESTATDDGRDMLAVDVLFIGLGHDYLHSTIPSISPFYPLLHSLIRHHILLPICYAVDSFRFSPS